MKCLIVTATAAEMNYLHIQNFAGMYKKLHINAAVTGVGILETTFRLQQLITGYSPDLIIQAGVGGSFTKELTPGAVVSIKKELVADMSVIEKKKLHSLADLKLQNPNEFPYRKGWLANPHAAFLKAAKCKQVQAVTVNQISTQKKMIQLYTDKWQPAVESMEGAALHYTALMLNIPFVQLRSISNHVGERNKQKWRMKLALENLNQSLNTLLLNLNNMQ